MPSTAVSRNTGITYATAVRTIREVPKRVVYCTTRARREMGAHASKAGIDFGSVNRTLEDACSCNCEQAMCCVGEAEDRRITSGVRLPHLPT